MDGVIFAYARYGQNDVCTEPTVEHAVRSAQAANEFGEAYAIGVYDPETNAAHMPRGIPLGEVPSDFREDRLDDLRALAGLKADHNFSSVSYFPSFPDYD